MKKMSIFFAAVFLFLATPIANADSDDYKKFFIGAGASYGIENFKEGNFDDTWGINAKIGYHPYDIFAVQLEYDYLSEFKDKRSL